MTIKGASHKPKTVPVRVVHAAWDIEGYSYETVSFRDLTELIEGMIRGLRIRGNS